MQKSTYGLILLYILLIGAFILNLDPNGGAFKDFKYHSLVANSFADNFYNTFFNYDKFATRHSPVFYIFLSFFYKLELNENIIRLIILHLGILLPFIFYKCLKFKYNHINKNSLVIFSCIIILSPSFISLTIWPDSRIFGLIFFCSSIYYFLKFKKKKKFAHTIKCIIFYSAASYLSPNFSLFSIFYFYNFLNFYKFKKEIFLIILLNIILSLPAILYIFSLENFFFLRTAVPSDQLVIQDYFNFSNKILIISSIIFFYILPFIITKSIKINLKNTKILLISFALLIIFSPNFNYNYDFTGGGIFFKISYYLFNNNLIFFIVCFFSLTSILNIFHKDVNNFILLLLLLASNPQYTIYHKYYDPFLLILFTTLFNFKLNQNRLFKDKTLLVFYLHIISFLILNLLK